MQTERLVLRRFTITDSDWLLRLDNDPEVMRYINGGIETPSTFILEKSLPLFMDYDPEVPGIGFWVIQRSGEHTPLGWCCLRLHTSSESASLGYRLARTAWGNGYVPEASQKLIDVAFDELGLEAIYASTYEENQASQRVLVKLGFRLHREFRVDLDDQPTAYFESTEPWPGIDLEFILDHSSRVKL